MVLLPERTWARRAGSSSVKRWMRVSAVCALPGTSDSGEVLLLKAAMLLSVALELARKASGVPCLETSAVAVARSRCS